MPRALPSKRIAPFSIYAVIGDSQVRGLFGAARIVHVERSDSGGVLQREAAFDAVFTFMWEAAADVAAVASASTASASLSAFTTGHPRRKDHCRALRPTWTMARWTVAEHQDHRDHNPESNMGMRRLRSSASEVERGIRVGLGSDAITSDMFESLKVANLIAKHEAGEPSDWMGRAAGDAV